MAPVGRLDPCGPAALAGGAACLLALLLAGCAPAVRGRPFRPLDRPAAAAPEVVWQRDAGRGIEVAPAVVESLLYVTGTDRRIQVWEAGSGKRLWRKRLDGALSAAPAVEGDVIYAATSQPDGTVYALRLDDRKILWRTRLGECAGDPVLFEGALLVATADGKVYGLSPADGRSIWATNLESRVWGRPLFARERALMLVPARNGRLYAVDGRSGERRWVAELGDPLLGVAIGADRAIATSVAGRVYAVDLTSGNVLWNRSIGMMPGSAPCVTGDSIYVAGPEGRLLALTAAAGDSLWSRSLGGPFPTPPVVSGEALLLASSGGLVWWLDRRTGEVLGEYQHPEGVRVTPLRWRDLWIVAGERGRTAACRWEGSR